MWLPAGSVRTLTRKGPATLRCLSGRVWLTQSGDHRDIVLAAGDTFACTHGKKIVAEGLDDAMLCVGD